jgi:ankyrin repeat protein
MVEILSWIFHAKESLHMEELKEALNVELEETDLDRQFIPSHVILEKCRSLVEFEESSGTVEFTHRTVYQFLKDTKPKELWSASDLAKRLLTYLSFDVFKKPCCSEAELQDRMKVNALCGYAARWWPEYVRGEGEENGEIQTLIVSLFRCPEHTRAILQMAASTYKSSGGCSLAHFATFYRFERICGHLFLPETFGHIQAILNHKLPTDTFGSVSSLDAYGESPLHIAARHGYPEIVKILLDANADINAKSGHSGDMTPIHLAIINGHTEVVEMLIKAGADLNDRGRYAQVSPLLLAAFLGRHEFINTLLNSSADIRGTISGVGETAIMRALTSAEAIRMIKSLVAAGINVNAADRDGRTALHYALSHVELSFDQCKLILELLFEAGADVNVRCQVTGNTPLHDAACIDLELRQYVFNLRENERRFSEESTHDIPPSERALEKTLLPDPKDLKNVEIIEIVELLLERGADFDARNLSGDTPLQCAIKSRKPAQTFALLRALLPDHDDEGVLQISDIILDSIGDQAFLMAMSEEVLLHTGNKLWR